jgi:lysophospholipase L1-like esterase
MRPSRKLLIAANILLLTLLVAVCVHEGYLQRAYKRLFVPPPPPYTYLDNPHYHEELDFARMYTAHPSIVMYGNSMVQKIQWQELLNRCDVSNRGVNVDLTTGILARVQEATRLHPKIVFIEGGINDVDARIDPATIVKNLTTTAKQIEAAGIRPVLMHITKVTSQYPGYVDVNTRISEVNKLISQQATEHNWDLVNLNPAIAANGALDSAYARADGCHLRSNAYLVWKEQILRILNKYKI